MTPGLVLWLSGVLVSLVVFALEVLPKSPGRIRGRPGQNTLDPDNRQQINNGNFFIRHLATVAETAPKSGGTNVPRSDLDSDFELQEYLLIRVAIQ